MEFVQELKGYCDDEKQQAMGETGGKHPFPCSSLLSKHRNATQRLWFESEEDGARSFHGTALELQGQEAVTNFNKTLELTDLSLSNTDEADHHGAGSHGSSDNDGGKSVERVHMFDKVVTPSDVGKLNRLVIPKQHAEKHFPLDSSSNEKGLLLNFEDRNGKPWRFRYSYWSSSQSYVMTKGWSRFVKEKKIDAGDIVSFERGVGESGKDRLYIDWRRRPHTMDPDSMPLLQHHNHLPFHQSVRWSRLYSLPISMSMSTPRDCEHLQQQQQQQMYYGIYPPPPSHYYHHTNQHQRRISYGDSVAAAHGYNVVNSGSASHFNYPRLSSLQQIGMLQEGGGDAPMVIESVPVVQGKTTTAKRLRLFGVNMECPTPDDKERNILSSTTLAPHVTVDSASSPSLRPFQLRLYNGAPLPTAPAQFPNKGKASSSFDLDI